MSELDRLELNREVMLRLIKGLIEGEELEKIAQIISLDPNLSARLLKFINSPFFGLRKEIKSIVQTVAYLGYKNLKDYIFVLLTSSFLKNKSREEMKNTIKYAYLLRELAEKLLPEHTDEAYMVGILAPVKEEIGEEIKEVLEKAGVSEYVINGLLDDNSKLGKIRTVGKKLMELCDDLTSGKNVNIPEEFSIFTKEELVEICLSAEDKAQNILSTL